MLYFFQKESTKYRDFKRVKDFLLEFGTYMKYFLELFEIYYRLL